MFIELGKSLSLFSTGRKEGSSEGLLEGCGHRELELASTFEHQNILHLFGISSSCCEKQGTNNTS